MLWAALLVAASSEPAAASPAAAGAEADATARALAVWALQFTPRVTLLEGAVLLELERSLRLFGGWQALQQRLREHAAELGARAPAWAATAQAALALARAGIDRAPPRELAGALDALPLHCLSEAAAHAALLQPLGCRSLGDLRRLPRAGLARRCGPRLLRQLDQAYGELAEQYAWVELPERFHARLELPARVADAPALLFGARRLLLQLEGWLGARQAGATELWLRWRCDTAAARPDDGELLLRSALPLRAADALARLLGEHLAHVRLSAPVLEIALELQRMQPLQPASASLLPAPPGSPGGEPGQGAKDLVLALQRVAARLGEQQVLQGAVLGDHRPEWAQAWRAFGLPAAAGEAPQPGASGPRPAFLLPEPLRLQNRDGRPWRYGPLQLLLGPQRIEGGWWHRDAAGGTAHVARDYWVAMQHDGALLWVFRGRGHAGACTDADADADAAAWFLHGVFA